MGDQRPERLMGLARALVRQLRPLARSATRGYLSHMIIWDPTLPNFADLLSLVEDSLLLPLILLAAPVRDPTDDHHAEPGVPILSNAYEYLTDLVTKPHNASDLPSGAITGFRRDRTPPPHVVLPPENPSTRPPFHWTLISALGRESAFQRQPSYQVSTTEHALSSGSMTLISQQMIWLAFAHVIHASRHDQVHLAEMLEDMISDEDYLTRTGLFKWVTLFVIAYTREQQLADEMERPDPTELQLEPSPQARH